MCVCRATRAQNRVPLDGGGGIHVRAQSCGRGDSTPPRRTGLGQGGRVGGAGWARNVHVWAHGVLDADLCRCGVHARTNTEPCRVVVIVD